MFRNLFFYGLLMIAMMGIACNNGIDLTAKNNAPKNEGPFQLCIQPFEEADDATILFLQNNLCRVYNASITVLPMRSLPRNAWYPERKRYWADSLLRFLEPLTGKGNSYVLGVTGKDISTKNSKYPNWGVMGLGYQPGHCCVISDYRMHVYPRTRQRIDDQLLKVAIHEIGHNLGLKHCPVQSCFMADAEGKNKMDEENGFCESCTGFLGKLNVLKSK